MKQSIMKHTALGLVMAAALISCKKDDTTPTPSRPNDRLKAIYAANSFDSIVYNPDQSVKSIITYQRSNRSVIETKTISYANNRITEMVATQNNATTGKWVYTYAGNDISRVDFLMNNALRIRYDFTYTNGRLATTTISSASNGQVSLEERHLYSYGNNGQLAKVEAQARMGNTWVKESEVEFPAYDNRRNTLYAFLNNPYLPLNMPPANNPTREIQKGHDGTVAETIDYTYTYDSQNRPLSRTMVRKVPGAPDETDSYTFVY